MIGLYAWRAPSGRKVSFTLEECGCAAHPVNVAKDEQFAPEFIAASLNKKSPAIVGDGESSMESGDMYLAEKAGRFWPRDDEGKWRTVERLMFQMGGVRPMFGQRRRFAKYDPGKAPYAGERHLNETRRLYGVMDRRLGDSACLAGGEYGVADIALWPWVARFDWRTVDDYPNVRRWHPETLDRPATRRGWNVPENDRQMALPRPGRRAARPPAFAERRDRPRPAIP